MLITLKEAAQWAEENLNIAVTPATLRSACVDKRLAATQENCSTGRRGQPCEWKVTPADLAAFLTGKFRSRRKRSASVVVSAEPVMQPALATSVSVAVAAAPAVEIEPAVVPSAATSPVAPSVAPSVAPVVPQPEALPVLQPRYKVLELMLTPAMRDYGHHDVYDMRVVKKNIPRHDAAEKLAIELASRALRSHLSHQLRYVIEEYQSQPRRK
ncbi:MAG: hypothetical protein J0I20_36485 [Chloroflexi bacterium]|nr:hypothetical protein [Chloroflexota bacterium]OJV91120.1 MAG: hypothetical protein BGO39_26385 [Chloroflexi bacterium 54-19]